MQSPITSFKPSLFSYTIKLNNLFLVTNLTLKIDFLFKTAEKGVYIVEIHVYTNVMTKHEEIFGAFRVLEKRVIIKYASTKLEYLFSNPYMGVQAKHYEEFFGVHRILDKRVVRKPSSIKLEYLFNPYIRVQNKHYEEIFGVEYFLNPKLIDHVMVYFREMSNTNIEKMSEEEITSFPWGSGDGRGKI